MSDCPKRVYHVILDQLVRGRCLSADEATALFAKDYGRKMKKVGVLDENQNILLNKLRDAYIDGTLDVNELANSIKAE